MRSPSDLFGVPFVVRRQDAQQLVDALHELWLGQMGSPVGTLEDDLNWLMSRLFNPKTSGAALRQLLAELPEAPRVRSRYLEPPLVIRTGPFLIVTPEGRAVCELLGDVIGESAADPVGIDLLDALGVVSLVYEGYRSVGVLRLQSVVELLSGDAEGLRLASIALLLFVLINGSSNPETAIRRPPHADERRRLDASVANAIAAFADSLSRRTRDLRHFSLYSGYAVTEARRRLGLSLGPSPDEIFVRDEERGTVVELVARELRRPKRSPPTAHVMHAFDNLVSAYRAERPTLASLGVTHESRIGTAQVRKQLEHALGDV